MAKLESAVFSLFLVIGQIVIFFLEISICSSRRVDYLIYLITFLSCDARACEDTGKHRGQNHRGIKPLQRMRDGLSNDMLLCAIFVFGNNFAESTKREINDLLGGCGHVRGVHNRD